MSVTDPEAPTQVGSGPSDGDVGGALTAPPSDASGDAPTLPPSDAGNETEVGGAATVVPGEADASLVGDGTRVLRRGDALGRYVILGVLGRGGMGIVYSAYDPELDRKLAIKLLLGGRRKESTGASRLAREAQAMARLAHPNVVAVHDVGTHDRDVFVAMEFIAGRTLTEWLKERNEAGADWREILGVFEPAGRGLAAAHAAGIVHRDFKPENVMVADNGRVVVLDFGLARPDLGGDGSASQSASSSTSASRPRLTVTGAMMGTPAYMSPEQFRGEAVDARSDQFSFCVSLFYGLFGVRPFAGSTVMELTHSVLHDAVRDPPRGSSVPAHVRRAVLRGMSRAPEERYPSMDQLLEALATDPGGRRRRIMAGILGLVALGTTLALTRPQPEPDPCDGVEAAIEPAWTPARRAEVEAAFRRNARAYSEFALDRVSEALADYVHMWRIERVNACRDTHGDDPVLTVKAAQRAACLDAAAGRVGALSRLLGDADQDMVASAVTAIEEIPAPMACRAATNDLASLEVPEEPLRQKAVEEVRSQLDRARALAWTGRPKDAREIADAALARAHEIGFEPLEVEVTGYLGSLYMALGDVEYARSLLEEAVLTARRTGRHGFAIDFGVDLAILMRTYGDNPELALWLLRSVRAELERHGASPTGFAQVDMQIATALHVRGRPEDQQRALAMMERSREVFEAHGVEHRVFETTIAMTGVLFALDRSEDAAALLEQGLEDAKRLFGPDHPDIATLLTQLAQARAEADRHEEAIDLLRQARRIYAQATGPQSAYAVAVTNGLGLELDELGHHEEALAHFREALELALALYPSEHTEVNYVRNNLANALRRHGEPAEALTLQRQVVEARTLQRGLTNPSTISARENLADDLRLVGRLDEAILTYADAIADRERAGGPTDWNLGYPLAGLALAQLASGDTTDAIASARRAVDVLSRDGERTHYRALAEYTLAYVLRRSGDAEGSAAAAREAEASFAASKSRGLTKRAFDRFEAGEDVAPVF